MRLYEDLVDKAVSLARAKRIKRVVLGLHYALAELERGGSGLSFVDREFLSFCCKDSEVSYWKQPADLLVKAYLSPSRTDTFLALAIMNALFNHRKELLKEATNVDPLEMIPLKPKDDVLMIGFFQPLFQKLQGRVKRIIVIEKGNPEENKRALENLPPLSLGIVTSATLANKSFHEYLPYLENISEVILMGPSTPLCPEVFKYTPVTWLCGVSVKDSELLFRLVCEGKGTLSFFKKGALEKVNLKVKK
ncbi:hypothetical protein THC_1408 [Caldimicrobium thiodismutans]|uniref:Heavy-metal chelation domain-containing protein n=1 Tax=Caldimicrobium thiodismutans TaxID=1653476 RepID=A0A0U5AYL3_9BACT|nr:DUF364 domain-containing protein [Caldimicrobium thiodismutans]BAU23774.1 hypothetical protein THC_1408 [Caldimicrobium thiodismutans]